jgi:polyhydroxyalkanoate synthesis regulator phasin
MANFEDIAKKAFYMGVGFASYAQEKASDTVKDLRVQAQKLAEEMAERGEMSTEEARKFVDDLMQQAQQGTVSGQSPSSQKEPRRIEIVDEESTPPTAQPEAKTELKTEQSARSNSRSDDLRQQVQLLQEELRRLKKEM